MCLHFAFSRHKRQKTTNNLQREVEQLQAKLGAIETAETDQVSKRKNTQEIYLFTVTQLIMMKLQSSLQQNIYIQENHSLYHSLMNTPLH